MTRFHPLDPRRPLPRATPPRPRPLAAPGRPPAPAAGRAPDRHRPHPAGAALPPADRMRAWFDRADSNPTGYQPPEWLRQLLAQRPHDVDDATWQRVLDWFAARQCHDPQALLAEWEAQWRQVISGEAPR